MEDITKKVFKPHHFDGTEFNEKQQQAGIAFTRENIAKLKLNNPEVFNIFYDITQIPRPSKKEEEIRQYTIEFAESLNLNYTVDEIGNVAIDIPATAGYEDVPRVMLQSHMDMVIKGDNYDKPTLASITGDILHSKDHQTTLGADNGVGMAMSLAVAKDNFEHGPITVLITVDEEDGLGGAKNLDVSKLPNNIKYVINLDSEEGVEYLCDGSAGGSFIQLERNITLETIPKNYELATISISELEGGHSGVDIHRERGNAILLLNELFIKMRCDTNDQSNIRLVDIDGGSATNAIPSNAQFTIAYEKSKKIKIINIMQNALLKNFDSIKRNFQVIKRSNQEMFSNDDTRIFMNSISLTPDGPISTLPNQPDRVISSNNLGLVKFNKINSTITLDYLARSSNEKELDKIIKQVEINTKQSMFNIADSDRFGGWKEPKNSQAVQFVVNSIEKIIKEKPKVFAYHAGLEVADILKKYNDCHNTTTSGVSMGPWIIDAHSEKESTSVTSVEETYAALREILKNVQ